MPVTQITLLPGYAPEVRERLVCRVSNAVRSVIASPEAGTTTFIQEVVTYQRDGRAFEGIRFIDRFELKDGLIVKQDVWNDLAEHAHMG